jgi:hypothetical protein
MAANGLLMVEEPQQRAFSPDRAHSVLIELDMTNSWHLSRRLRVVA